jgi:hypothetical protein
MAREIARLETPRAAPPVAAKPSLPPAAPPATRPPPRAAQPTPAPQPAPVAQPTPPTKAVALDALFEARPVPGGRGLFASRPIAKETRLFGEDEWSDEEERRNFSTLSPQQVQELKPALRAVFLRYAYNTAPEAITGAFRPEAVRHPINFINHSCDPNAGYNGAGEIVALRSIAVGEEIRMDYGTYSFSFDHEFTCRCGASWCRGKVTGKDWPELVRAGLRLPGFMRALADRALWG